MIDKVIKFRGMKQQLTFLTDGDIITDDCFHYWTFRDNKTYNEMVMDTIAYFKECGGASGSKTSCAGENVNEHPERVYFRIAR